MAESQGRKRARAAVDKKKNPGEAKKSVRKKLAEPPKDLGYSAAAVNEVMFPVGKKVRLSSGETVEVRPWSIKTFGLMAQRIPETLDKATALEDEDSAGMVDLITNLTDEVMFMVGETLDMTADEIHETMTFDDLLLVATAIWDECIAGPMGKIGGLMGRVVGTAMPLTTAEPTKKITIQQPSSSPSST